MSKRYTLTNDDLSCIKLALWESEEWESSLITGLDETLDAEAITSANKQLKQIEILRKKLKM